MSKFFENIPEIKFEGKDSKNPFAFKFYDADISGPGILISPKSMKCSNKIPYMTSCRYKKPFTSVYIRFKSAEDEKKIIYGKVVYYGYIAEREVLMDYLQSIDVTLQ